MATDVPRPAGEEVGGEANGAAADAHLGDEEKNKVEVIGSDKTCLTFKIHDEDHTLGNALRYVLMKDKEVEFCGYNIPHPSDDFVNIRVQTFGGKSATDVFRRALSTLAEMTDCLREKFNAAVDEAGATV